MITLNLNTELESKLKDRLGIQCQNTLDNSDVIYFKNV